MSNGYRFIYNNEELLNKLQDLDCCKIYIVSLFFYTHNLTIKKYRKIRRKILFLYSDINYVYKQKEMLLNITLTDIVKENLNNIELYLLNNKLKEKLPIKKTNKEKRLKI